MDFEDHYEETVSILYNLRLAANGDIKLKLLDFRRLKHISLSAALVLASEVDQWNHQVKRGLRAQVYKWHEDIRRLLAQMGYFELLNLKKPRFPAFSKPTVFMPVQSGVVVEDEDAGILAKTMRIEIEKTIGTKIKKLELFGGLSEAITNVSHHAYSKEASRKRWWLSASYDQSIQRLSVTFYDQGAGIPATLPFSKLRAFIVNFLDLNLDSQRIEAAMRTGKTSTGKPERGKGLQNLLEFARAYENGTVAIYSLRGMYRINARKNGDETNSDRKRKDFENSIGGTLIEWSVNIPPSI